LAIKKSSFINEMYHDFEILKSVKTLHITDMELYEGQYGKPISIKDILLLTPNITTLVLSGLNSKYKGFPVTYPDSEEELTMSISLSHLACISLILPIPRNGDQCAPPQIVVDLKGIVIKHKKVGKPLDSMQLNLYVGEEDTRWFQSELKQFEIAPHRNDFSWFYDKYDFLD